jgi:hypothetical protein
MSLITEQWLFLQDVVNLILKAKELGLVLTAGELWRPETQAWVNSLPPNCSLIAVEPNTVKHEFGAKVGGVGILKSKHQDRLAVDFNVFKADNVQAGLCSVEQTRPLGEYWESLSTKNRWGGNFTTRKDAPHFERNLG